MCKDCSKNLTTLKYHIHPSEKKKIYVSFRNMGNCSLSLQFQGTHSTDRQTIHDSPGGQISPVTLEECTLEKYTSEDFLGKILLEKVHFERKNF